MTTVVEMCWEIKVNDEYGVVDAITNPNGERTSHWLAWHHTPDKVREAVVEEIENASHVEDLCPIHNFAR